CRLDGAGPLYSQIYRALRAEILARRLAPGTRLPSTRALASDLGVSRNVAMLAYEQLLGEGYAEARTGSGTIVARALPGQWAPPSGGATLHAADALLGAPPRLARAGTRAVLISRTTFASGGQPSAISRTRSGAVRSVVGHAARAGAISTTARRRVGSNCAKCSPIVCAGSAASTPPRGRSSSSTAHSKHSTS